MAQLETNLEELLGIIARQSIIINRQDKAITEITELYNQKLKEIEELKSDNVYPIERTHG